MFEGIIVFYSEIIVNVTSNLNFNEEKINEFILNPPTITFFLIIFLIKILIEKIQFKKLEFNLVQLFLYYIQQFIIIL